jgi:hypothetical protein
VLFDCLVDFGDRRHPHYPIKKVPTLASLRFSHTGVCGAQRIVCVVCVSCVCRVCVAYVVCAVCVRTGLAAAVEKRVVWLGRHCFARPQKGGGATPPRAACAGTPRRQEQPRPPAGPPPKRLTVPQVRTHHFPEPSLAISPLSQACVAHRTLTRCAPAGPTPAWPCRPRSTRARACLPCVRPIFNFCGDGRLTFVIFV